MKQPSRIMAFILATALTLAVSVGVLAYDDHLAQTLEGYGDYQIMPLDLSSLVFSASMTGTLTITNTGFTNLNGSRSGANLLTSGSTFNGAFYESSLSSSVSFNGGSLTLSNSSGISFDGSGSLRLVSNFNPYFYVFPGDVLMASGTQVFKRWTPSNSTRYRPSTVSVYFGNDLVHSFSPSSYTNSGFDITIPVTGPVSSFRIVYQFSSFSASTSYTSSTSGTGGGTYGYRSGNSTNTFVAGYLVHQSTDFQVEFQPDTVESLLGRILSAIQELSGVVSQPSPMEQFENNYLENFGGQISQVESALSPSNPALPNGGDIGGFVSDVSGSLGLNGSSFDGAQFESATGAFSGSESTGAGGPWEFFTQGVADDLSGDSPSGIDLDELDPILQWFEQAERRGSSWFNRS